MQLSLAPTFFKRAGNSNKDIFFLNCELQLIVPGKCKSSLIRSRAFQFTEFRIDPRGRSSLATSFFHENSIKGWELCSKFLVWSDPRRKKIALNDPDLL